MGIEDSVFTHRNPSRHTPLKTGVEVTEMLNVEEYNLVKFIFVDLFDAVMHSYVTEGDVAELSEFIADLQTNYRIFKSFSTQVVEVVNSDIFRKEVTRAFILELLSRFSISIAPIGNDAFKRLINTIAFGVSVCGAIHPEKSLGLMPILESVRANNEDVRTVYLENPWHVICTMLVMEFKRTAVGKNVNSGIIS